MSVGRGQTLAKLTGTNSRWFSPMDVNRAPREFSAFYVAGFRHRRLRTGEVVAGLSTGHSRASEPRPACGVRMSDWDQMTVHRVLDQLRCVLNVEMFHHGVLVKCHRARRNIQDERRFLHRSTFGKKL